MKRRTFLGVALSSFGAPVLAKGTSLYGTPGSLLNGLTKVSATDSRLLTLPLAEVGIPDTALSDLGAYAGIWQKVLSNAGERQAFSSNPGIYLEANGVPPAVLSSGDQEVRMLLALADEEVIKQSISGDYSAFFSTLKSLGLVGGRPSMLKTRVSEVLKPRAEQLKQMLRSSDAENGASLEKLIKGHELEYLYSQIIPDLTQVATAAVPVAAAAVIVVTVVAYISVGVAVTVGAMAGVYVSVAVSMAVTASGGGGGGACEFESESKPMFAGPPSGPLPKLGKTSERERSARGEFLQRALVGKRMLMLDPQRVEDARTAARVAVLLGNQSYAVEAGRQIVRDEIEAIVSSLEELKIIEIAQESRSQVVTTLHNVALKAAGLS